MNGPVLMLYGICQLAGEKAIRLSYLSASSRRVLLIENAVMKPLTDLSLKTWYFGRFVTLTTIGVFVIGIALKLMGVGVF